LCICNWLSIWIWQWRH